MSTWRHLQHLPYSYFLLCFALMVVNKLGFDVSGGEEQYLAFSRQYLDPEWIPGSFSLTEFAGSRIVFQWIMGFFMQRFSFEAVVFGARLVNFLLLSIPLGLFFHRLRFSLPFVFVAFQLFLMSEQNLFGGEWIIKTFEPKTVAYIFVFFALYHLTRSEHRAVAVHLALATYFHVLIGGWTILVIGLLQLSERHLRKAIEMAALYGIVVLPFALYLFSGYFGNEPPASGYNLDWIYCYYRLPNHIGIWVTTDYFLKGHALGVALTLAMFAAGFWWKRYLRDTFRMLNNLMLIIFAINLLFVGVVATDHFIFDNSGGFGLKYYPFRTNALGMFLALIIVLKLLHDKLRATRYHTWIFRVVFVVILLLAAAQVVNNIKRSVKYFRADPDYRALCHYISQHTRKSDVFLLLQPDYGNPEYYAFNRRAERENFVVAKFVSAERTKLAEWYQRMNAFHRARRNLDSIVGLRELYGVNYIVLGEENSKPYLELAHTEGRYHLYRIVRPGIR